MYKLTTTSKMSLIQELKDSFKEVREAGKLDCQPYEVSNEEKALFEIGDDVQTMGALNHFLHFSKANTPEEKSQVLEGVLGILNGEAWEPLIFEEERDV